MRLFASALILHLLSLLTVSASAAARWMTSEKLQQIIDAQDLQKLVDSSESAAEGETAVDWSSMDPGLEFTRVQTDPKYTPAFDSAVARFAEQTYDTQTNTSTVHSLSCAASPYEEYGEYQIAWRYLGFAIDCTYMGQYNSHQRGRKMKSNDATGTACSRVLLYAVVR
jgi:hypothetical protein